MPWPCQAASLVWHEQVHVSLSHEAALNLAHDDGAHVAPAVQDGQAHWRQGVGVRGLNAVQDLQAPARGKQAGIGLLGHSSR